MDGSKPDLLVGIDFGMTCTGVSYANLSIGSENVKWIQKWPGRSQANENKVPTVVVYPSNQTVPSSWGFVSETASEQHADDKDYRDWFKTYLDPARLAQQQQDDPEDAPKSIKEVEKWYEDYLRLLYRHIEFKLASEIQGAAWQDARIEFIFSVPTTWNPEVVETYRVIAQRAGFGGWPSHQVTIGLTEAEAAAVHTSIEASGIFRERDVLLVCDAGGGTTDLSVLRVTDTGNHSLSLEQLDVVFGATIGSAAIDNDFDAFVRGRLEQADRHTSLGVSPEAASWQMMKSKDFQNTKCEHGSPDDSPIFSVPIPKINPHHVDHSVAIENGEMRFSREDLRRLFDLQVQKLIALIDSQLQSIQKKFPDQQVAHLVLSGGLGHSPYVQQRLRSRYVAGGGHPNARNLQVRIAPDPQLAVCKGIVADRVRKLKVGKAVLKSRCCRASYGTICKELYNKNKPQHVGRATTVDPMNGKLYVTQSIAWFIVRGEPVSSDSSITHNFTRKIQPGDPRKAFPTSVVVSHVEKEFLPHQMGPDAKILCEVQSDLSAADERQFKRKNRHFWNTGKPYFKVDYQVKVLIGPADIRFELWFNGQKLNKDEPIKVEWTTSEVPEPPRPTKAVWKEEEPVLKVPLQKPSMNFRRTPQELGNSSSPNLPYEMGSRSPPPMGSLSNASGALSPPAQSGLYPNGMRTSSSRLNLKDNAGGTRSPSMNSGLDFQGLHVQSPPPSSPGYSNGSDKIPTNVAPNGYGNPSSPRNYLAGFRELP